MQGEPIDNGNSSDSIAVIGKAIYRNMSVGDTDERSAKRDVTAEAAITVPAISNQEHKLLGRFRSRPIRVISKPSKKRQASRGTDRE